MDYVIDTGFLVGRWRGKAQSPEQRFLQQHPDQSVAMPWIVKGEFLRGALIAGHAREEVQEFLSRFATLWVSEATIALYAETYAALVKKNQLIGPNDLWIAASTLENALPLLTRNAMEFSHVSGLQVIDYAAAE